MIYHLVKSMYYLFLKELITQLYDSRLPEVGGTQTGGVKTARNLKKLKTEEVENQRH